MSRETFDYALARLEDQEPRVDDESRERFLAALLGIIADHFDNAHARYIVLVEVARELDLGRVPVDGDLYERVLHPATGVGS